MLELTWIPDVMPNLTALSTLVENNAFTNAKEAILMYYAAKPYTLSLKGKQYLLILATAPREIRQQDE